MWATVSVYVALILIAIVLYYLTKHSAKSSGVSNFWERFKQNSMANFGLRNAVGASRMPANPSGDVDVVAVLEDIYREFRAETEQIRRDFEQAIQEMQKEYRETLAMLEQEIRTLRHTHPTADPLTDAVRDAQAVQTSAAPTPSSLKRPQVALTASSNPAVNHTSESNYYRILDELQQGKSPLEIVAELGVSLDEVHRVIQFMSRP